MRRSGGYAYGIAGLHHKTLRTQLHLPGPVEYAIEFLGLRMPVELRLSTCRYAGLGQALPLISVHSWMHEFTNLGTVLGGIGRDSVAMRANDRHVGIGKIVQWMKREDSMPRTSSLAGGIVNRSSSGNCRA